MRWPKIAPTAVLDASHIISKGNSHLGACNIGAFISASLMSKKEDLASFPKEKSTLLQSKCVKCLAILAKS